MKCPKCGKEMYEDEQDISKMTDGQMSDYFAGFNRPFSCECGHYQLFDVPVDEYSGDDELDMIGDEINDDAVEDLINRAIEKRCFIEVLSLIHNTIELYLRFKLEKFLFKQHNIRFDDIFGLSKEPNKEQLWKKHNIDTKLKVLYGHGKNRLKNLSDYSEICFMFGVIDYKLFLEIRDFNRKRNRTIHELLKKAKEGKECYKYREIIETAKLGRKIQLILSPINHSPEAINMVIKRNFDIDPKEAYNDPFLDTT